MILLAQLSLLLAGVVSAESVWVCRGIDGSKPIYTVRPVQSESTECTPANFRNGSFNRSDFTILTRAGPATKQSSVGRGRLKGTGRVLPLFVPTTSWSAKEVRLERAGSRLQTICQIFGKASAKCAGVAEIRVRRGSVTLDKKRIVFGSGVRKIPWELELAGKCQSPRVEIIPIMVNIARGRVP